MASLPLAEERSVFVDKHKSVTLHEEKFLDSVFVIVQLSESCIRTVVHAAHGEVVQQRPIPTATHVSNSCFSGKLFASVGALLFAASRC